MMEKWICDKCNWEGDEPYQAYEHFEDGGYSACPNGCVDKKGEAHPVALNPNHPENMRKYAKTVFGRL